MSCSENIFSDIFGRPTGLLIYSNLSELYNLFQDYKILIFCPGRILIWIVKLTNFAISNVKFITLFVRSVIGSNNNLSNITTNSSSISDILKLQKPGLFHRNKLHISDILEIRKVCSSALTWGVRYREAHWWKQPESKIM